MCRAPRCDVAASRALYTVLHYQYIFVGIISMVVFTVGSGWFGHYGFYQWGRVIIQICPEYVFLCGGV